MVARMWGEERGRGGFTVTLCPACFSAVAAVRPAIPAPTMRTLSLTGEYWEPITKTLGWREEKSRCDFKSGVPIIWSS